MTRTSRLTARRASATTAVFAAAALALTACSSDADPDSTTPDEGNGETTEETTEDPAEGSSEDVTLEMSWWGDDARAALFGEVIALFEAEHPNISVTQTPVGSPDDLFNRLATDFGTGGDTAPDVFALGGAKPQEYGSAGALLDMGTVADTVQVDKYPEFSTTNAIVDGKLYGLPTGGNATAAFVNTDILAEAGVDVPDGSWTWDDLVSIANTVGNAGLTNANGDPVYGIDLRVQDIVGTYAAQESELGIYDWDGNLAIDADVIAGLYEIELELRDGGGLPDPTIVTEGWALPPDQQLYTLGQAAVSFGYSNLVGTYAGAGETIVLSPPTNTGKTGVALLPSAFWSINAASAHPEEAALLVDWFLNQPAAAELILDTRGVPFNPDTNAVVAPLLEGDSKVAAEYVASVLDSGEVAPPQPDGGANMNKYTQDGESDVLFDSATPMEAAETWISQLGGDLE